MAFFNCVICADLAHAGRSTQLSPMDRAAAAARSTRNHTGATAHHSGTMAIKHNILLQSAVLLVALANVSPAKVAAQCGLTRWSAPRSFSPTHTVARFGSVSVAGNRVMIAGDRIHRFDDTPIGDSSLVILSSDTTTLGRPAGKFLFLAPRIATDRSGRIYLFWAETDSSAPLRHRDVPMAMSRLRSLWYAAYTSRTGWTPARRLYVSAGRLAWSAETFTDPVVSDDGVVHLVAPGFFETLYIRAADGEATASPIAGLPPTIFAAVELSRQGVLRVAYVAHDHRDGRDGSAIYLTVSVDSGHHWLPSQIVFSSEEHKPNQVKLLGNVDGDTLYAVWTMVSPTMFTPSGAAIAISSDGGASWLPPVITATEGVIRFEAARDAGGTTHVIFDHWALGAMHGHVDYLRWRGRWSRPEHLSPSEDALDPRLSVSPSGNIVLTYIGRAPDALRSKPWSTLWRQLTCAERVVHPR